MNEIRKTGVLSLLKLCAVYSITYDSNLSPENIFSGRNARKLYDASKTRISTTL